MARKIKLVIFQIIMPENVQVINSFFIHVYKLSLPTSFNGRYEKSHIEVGFIRVVDTIVITKKLDRSSEKKTDRTSDYLKTSHFQTVFVRVITDHQIRQQPW